MVNTFFFFGPWFCFVVRQTDWDNKCPWENWQFFRENGISKKHLRVLSTRLVHYRARAFLSTHSSTLYAVGDWRLFVFRKRLIRYVIDRILRAERQRSLILYYFTQRIIERYNWTVVFSRTRAFVWPYNIMSRTRVSPVRRRDNSFVR